MSVLKNYPGLCVGAFFASACGAMYLAYEDVKNAGNNY